MLAYHGSSQSGLKKLEYSEELSRFGGEENLVHGAGIYLTTSFTEAMAYATSSLYKIKVSGEIFDATDPEALTSVVQSIAKELNDSENLLMNHLYIKLEIGYTSNGIHSAISFPKNIANIIENDPVLYEQIVGKSLNYDLDKLEEIINSLFQYKIIKIKHRGNNTHWIICLSHDGSGLEIIEEIDASTF